MAKFDNKEKFVKITEDIYLDENLDVERLLVPWVRTIVIGNTCDFRDSLITSLIDCESPIEQLLAIAMESTKLCSLPSFNPAVKSISIDNQQEIRTEYGNYRVDFLIKVVYTGKKEDYCIDYVVECDGYDFHQKTREQVQNDNARARALQKEGYEIIRFSGTEIWHRAYKCSQELLDIILSNCNKY